MEFVITSALATGGDLMKLQSRLQRLPPLSKLKILNFFHFELVAGSEALLSQTSLIRRDFNPLHMVLDRQVKANGEAEFKLLQGTRLRPLSALLPSALTVISFLLR